MPHSQQNKSFEKDQVPLLFEEELGPHERQDTEDSDKSSFKT